MSVGSTISPNRKYYKTALFIKDMDKNKGKDMPMFVYDEISDRLFISSKKEGEKIYGSVRLLNITLDFTTSGRVANIELRGASEYLESLRINPDILSSLTGAEIVVQQRRDGYLIYFILKAGKNVERIPYNILTEKKISVTSA